MKEVIGNFRFVFLMTFSPVLILLTIFATYFISVSYHEESKYPGLSITGTGLHFPQCILFRFGMGIFSGFFYFHFISIFKWLQRQAAKYNYQGCIYRKMYWPTILSINGYVVMVATIDSGGTRQTLYEGVLHVAGAIIYCLFLSLLALNTTIISLFIWKKNRSFMKTWSLILKMLIVIYQLTYIFVYLPLLSVYQHPKSAYQILIFVNKGQWNLVVGCILWMGLLFDQFKDVKILLLCEKKLIEKSNADADGNPRIQQDQTSEMKIGQSKNEHEIEPTK